MIRSPTDSDYNQNCFSPSLTPTIQSPTLQSPTVQSPTLSLGNDFMGIEGRTQPPRSLSFSATSRNPLARQNAMPSCSSSPRSSPGPQIPEEGLLSSLPASPYPPEWTQPNNKQPFRKSEPSVFDTDVAGRFPSHTLDPQHMNLRHRSQPSVNRSRSMGSGDPSPVLSKYQKSRSQPHTDDTHSPLHPDEININMFDPYPRMSPSNSSITDDSAPPNISPTLGEEDNHGVFHPLKDGPPPSYEEATEEEPFDDPNNTRPKLNLDIPKADDVNDDSEHSDGLCDEEVRQINALSPEDSSAESGSDSTSINAILSGLEDSLVADDIASPDLAVSSCNGGCVTGEGAADPASDLPSPPHYEDVTGNNILQTHTAEPHSTTESLSLHTDSNTNTVGCMPSACSQSQYDAIAQNLNKSDASHSEPAGSSVHMQMDSSTPPPAGSHMDGGGGDSFKRTRSCVVDETQEPVKRRKSQIFRPQNLPLAGGKSNASVIVNKTQHDGDEDVEMADTSPACSNSDNDLPDVLSGTAGNDGGYV